MRLIFSLVALLLFVAGVHACNSYDYHYNVVDCKEPQLQALGDYILDKLRKQQREVMGSTCYDEPTKYLKAAPFSSSRNDFDAKRMAGVWLFKKNNEPDTIFGGPEATLDALERGDTYNILVDKRFSVHRYILRNSTDGSMKVAFLNEEQLLAKVTSEVPWAHLDIVECEAFIFHLSKEYGNQLVTFTVVDKASSNSEFRFIAASQGIGGFYKSNE